MMELTQNIRPSGLSLQDARPIFGPEGSPVTRVPSGQGDSEKDISMWVGALWEHRVSRLKHSRWNTRWAGLRQ